MSAKYKKGDKVIINSKSYWSPLKSSFVYKEGKRQGYWYFINYEYPPNTAKIVCIISNRLNDEYDGDYFLESDIVHYEDIMIAKIKGDLFEI